MLFDTHTHLDDEQFREDFDAAVQRAADNGVARMMIVACDEASSARSLELSQKDARLFCSVGVHPHDASTFDETLPEKFRRMIRENPEKIRAVGEIGLDYHYDFSPRDVQRDVFARLIDLSIECGLPFIVHDREAHGDCLDIVRSFAKAGRLPEMPGVFHCYSGSYEMAKLLLNDGFYISFGGPVTFKNAHKALEILPKIPPDRLLLETDCPYLAPEPMRGHRNEPAYVRYVSEKVAQITGKTVSEIEDITFANACRLFRIPQN